MSYGIDELVTDLRASSSRHTDEVTMAEVRRLRDEAERVGFKSALPALEKALADP